MPRVSSHKASEWMSVAFLFCCDNGPAHVGMGVGVGGRREAPTLIICYGSSLLNNPRQRDI